MQSIVVLVKLEMCVNHGVMFSSNLRYKCNFLKSFFDFFSFFRDFFTGFLKIYVEKSWFLASFLSMLDLQTDQRPLLAIRKNRKT